MRGRRAIPALAAAAALLAAVPVAAAATPTAPALRAGVSRLDAELSLLARGSAPLGSRHHLDLVELKFENRDGYEIEVLGFGQTVALSVSRGKHPAATTTYLVHGKVTPRSIEASLGERGRIAVRLRPTGRTLRVPRRSGCGEAGGAIGRLGVFVGSLHFRGEGGYTSADVHRAGGGSVDLTALFSCLSSAERGAARSPTGLPVGPLAFGSAAATASGAPGVRTHPSNSPPISILFADRKLPLSRTAFAAEARAGKRVRLVALDERSEGSIAVVRYAQASAPPSTFASDNALSQAGVTPPAPFSGSATFLRGPGGASSWTGTLAASFPGAPRVPLTGPDFSPELVRSW
jgi:hypothetical protein